MKVLKKIKDIFVFILGVVFFLFALTMTVLLLNFNDFGLTQFGDNTFVIITNEIASENYKKGDLVIVESRGISNYKEGDQLFTYRIDTKRQIHVDQGIVGKLYPDENALSFENGNTYSEEFIAGVPVKTINDIGTFLGVVESKWGFLFVVLVPSFLIFLYEVYALVMEIKYGADDYGDEDEEDEEVPKKKTTKKKSSEVKKDGNRSKRRKESKEEESLDEDKVVRKKKTKTVSKRD